MPPKSTQFQMHRYDDRLSSFKAITKPKKDARAGWPLLPDTHPLLTPENMAFAGFYYSPGGSDASVDTCVCFLCGITLGGWDKGDDPCVEHVKRGDCAWADTVCQVEIDQRKVSGATYANKDALPSSSTSSRVRENTFYSKDREACWWPHPIEHFVPNPSTLAEAGFIFCPTVKEWDLVRCPLCKYEVEGWEADDDPMEIHRNKHSDCSFFTAEIAGKSNKRTKGKKQIPETEAEVDVLPAPAATTRKGHSRTNSRSQPTTTTPATAVSVAGSSRTRQQTSEAPSESRGGRSTRTRPKRGQNEDEAEVEVIDLVEEEDEDEFGQDTEMEEVQTKSKSKAKSTRRTTVKSTSASRKSKKADQPIETDTEHEDVGLIEPKEEEKEALREAEQEEETVLEPTKKGSKSKSRSKSSRKTIKAAPASLVDESQPQSQTQNQPEINVEETTTDQDDTKGKVKTSTKSTKSTRSTKSTKSKSNMKSKATAESEIEDERPQDEVEAGAMVGMDVDEEVTPSAPAPAAKSKSVRKPRTTTKSKKAVEVEQETEVELETDPGQMSVQDTVPALKAGSKPLPALPRASSSQPQLHTHSRIPSQSQSQSQPEQGPTRAQGRGDDRALSQLERFANIPPSSPVSAPAPGGRVTKSIPLKKGVSQPTRPIQPKTKISTKSAQSIPLETGARAARSVIDSTLNALSPGLPSPINIQPQPQSTHTQTIIQKKEPVVEMTESEQMGMTLENWIRSQMDLKRAEIEQEGMERIRAFERRTVEARRRIENLPTR